MRAADSTTRGVPLPQTRRARGLFITLVMLATGALVGIPVAGSTDPAADEKEEATAKQEESDGGSRPEETSDADGDGIPDVNDTAPYDSADAGTGDSFDESAPDAGQDTTEQDSGPEQTYRTIGQAGVDDDVTFKVISLEEVDSIATDEYSDGPIRPPSGAKLVKAVVKLKNNMSTKIDPFCGGDSAVLLDQDDRNYEPKSDDMIDIPGNEICGDGVAPGFQSTQTLAFTMPADSEIGGLVLWNSEAEDDYSGDTTQLVFTP